MALPLARRPRRGLRGAILAIAFLITMFHQTKIGEVLFTNSNSKSASTTTKDGVRRDSDELKAKTTMKKRKEQNPTRRRPKEKGNATETKISPKQANGKKKQKKKQNNSSLIPSSAKAATTTGLVARTDFIYKKGHWDAAPIVVEEYKLIFFTIPKVACTVWKMLFRKMMKYEDWNVQTLRKRASMLPYNPEVNGLTYLYHYSLEDATRLMTSPEYTRAVFVRDPKERFLSAYLDKALRNGGAYLKSRCCPDSKCVQKAQKIAGFLELIQKCRDDHWAQQHLRFEQKYWPTINFVGHYTDLGSDARRLLDRIGAWEEHGKTGWGKYGNESIFKSSNVKHSTGAVNRIQKYITSVELERKIEKYYVGDYASPWLNLTKLSFVASPSTNVSAMFA